MMLDTAPLKIRRATAADRPELRLAFVELQNCENLRHPSRLPGEQVADAYLAWMLQHADVNDGVVLVAESGDVFVGFVAGWIEEETKIEETPASNRFGYISDICVMPAFRGRRIAMQLLASIEQYLCRVGVTRLRLYTLAVNAPAQASYERAGFSPYEIVYEKVITIQSLGERNA